MGLKKNLTAKFIEKAAESKTSKFIDAVRIGWNGYSFIFYIGSIAAILGSIFGWAGWITVIITIILFYFAGRFKEKLDLQKKRRKRSIKRRA